MSGAFPRSARLLRKREFRLVFDHGRSRADTRFIVYARPRDDDGASRLGLVVSRRFGNSVERNAWKRRVRETFRTAGEELPPGHDLIVLPAKPGSVPDPSGARESLLRVAGAAARMFATRGPR